MSLYHKRVLLRVAIAGCFVVAVFFLVSTTSPQNQSSKLDDAPKADTQVDSVEIIVSDPNIFPMEVEEDGSGFSSHDGFSKLCLRFWDSGSNQYLESVLPLGENSRDDAGSSNDGTLCWFVLE